MSEVREGYKMTELGEIPIEWESNKLSDLGITYGGLSGKRKEDFLSGNKQMISYKDVYKNPFILNPESSVLILDEEQQNKVLYGDILFTGSSETPEEVAMSSVYLNHKSGDVYLNSFCFGYRFRDLTKIVPNFFGYYFRGEYFRKLTFKFAQGSTRFNISKTKLVDSYIHVPPFKEQQKIASILSTVDEQIDETEQLIVKTKELKKGLMQQLLTKGIGHTEFKQTELGEIPSEWQVLKLNNIAEVIMGQSPNSNSYNESKIGLPFYQGKSEFGKRYPTPVKWCSEPTKIAEKNDILISVRAPVGEVNICQETSCIGRGVGAIRATKESSNLFLYYSLQLAKEALNKMSQGSTFTAINGAELKNVPLAVPTKVEQQKIASILSTVDEQIDVYEQEKAKYEELKKGLMQQLLTGQIRVKI